MITILTSKLFWIFVVLNFINVLVNTARSLLTIKGGKWIASVMNAVCYGYYTIIIVITATYEMPLLIKCIAVAFVNFVGVFTIKYCEEKMQKDKMWIYNATAIQIFSNTQKESEMIKAILENYNIKYYAIESKEINGN